MNLFINLGYCNRKCFMKNAKKIVYQNNVFIQLKCLYDESNNSYLLKYTAKLLVLQEGSSQKTIFKFIFFQV